MRLRNYKKELHKRLEDPEYAALYLAETLKLADTAAFLVALKDVVEAAGGVGALSRHVEIQRPSLYKILSENGNPTLSTLQQILEPLGLYLTISSEESA